MLQRTKDSGRAARWSRGGAQRKEETVRREGRDGQEECVHAKTHDKA